MHVLEHVGFEHGELAHERAVAVTRPLRRLIVARRAAQVGEHRTDLFVLAPHVREHRASIVDAALHQRREQRCFFLGEMQAQRLDECVELSRDIAQRRLAIAVNAGDLGGERVEIRHRAMQVLVMWSDQDRDHFARRQRARIDRFIGRLASSNRRLELADNGSDVETEVPARVGQRPGAFAAVIDAMARQHGGALGMIEHELGNGLIWIEHAVATSITCAGMARATYECMLFQIGRRADSVGVEQLLSECHARIRRFLDLALRLSESHGVPDHEIRDAAGQVLRYFTTGFPLHLADEEQTLVPRLVGREATLDTAIAQMRSDHNDHAPLTAQLATLCETLVRDPRQLAACATALAEAGEKLAVVLEAHLSLEELVIFPALRTLSTNDHAAIRDEMRMRRDVALAAG